MHIEEVILEGFKSYATRTSITGWDPEFNAITGLNGTGKSNILDAICFVLGIDNLKQVRATSLQDLVYKKGQAGITKAAVTVVFSNSDPATSPIGYTDCSQVTVTRQIVLNGKNKYLINGHVAQQKAVENLFQSVQLNVNNPHFLIMQGQITRVLNMKPPEILAMIEESAGTRMFEDHKMKALGTMEKKERKVEEIAELLSDIIEPRLNSLRAQRSEFLEYKRTEADLERLSRILSAHEYVSLNKEIDSDEQHRVEQSTSLTQLEDERRHNQLELERVTDQIFTLTKKREKEFKASNKLRELEDACKETSAKMVRLQTDMDFKKETLLGEESAMTRLMAEIEDEHKRILNLEKTFAKADAEFNVAKEKQTKSASNLARDEELLRSLQTGLSTEEGSSDTGYAKLLREARDKLCQAQTAYQQGQQRIAALKNEMANLQPQVARASKDSSQMTLALEKCQKELEQLHTALANKKTQGSVQDTRVLNQLYDRKSELAARLAVVQEELSALQSTVNSVDFRYSPINKAGFDPSKVKGMVAKLIHINDGDQKYATALEIAAGGKLYNVVVEDEVTATALLEAGRLTRRVTIIPLNKIQGRKIPRDAIAMAEKVCNNRARIGLCLCDYDGNLKSAMEYIFGSTFVCDDKDTAEMIAFDRKFGYSAVTMDGDVYEPSGTLSGGAAPSSGGILTKLDRAWRLSEEESRLSAQLDALKGEIELLEKEKRSCLEEERRIKVKEQELENLTKQFQLESTGQLILKFEQVKKDLVHFEAELERNHALIQELTADCQKYEKESTELANDREGKLSSLMKQIKKANTALEKESVAFKKISEEYQKVKNDLEASRGIETELQGKLSLAKEQIKEIEGELEKSNEEYLQLMTYHNGQRVKLDAEMRHLRQYDEEIRTLDDSKKELESFLENFALKKKQIEDVINSINKKLDHAKERIKSILAANRWLNDDVVETFGKADGPFDFSVHNISELHGKVGSLERAKDTLRKTINFNVMDMLDRVEAKDTSLKQMLATVKKDRDKIDGTITKLNDYMLDALTKTWKKVNVDFGQIFSELLPGSTAKLDPVEGSQTITEGLEIKVCLGGVWKNGLAELSGGQRSLVALSLILALLQFRPAPMYILDEVDAALDLSHTENIGRLLNNRFKGSQFIVVSLKEGMFGNANVLFRTHFKDGVSAVERITESGK